MFYNLWLGNFFSFLAAISLAVSVTKKNKHDLIKWLIINTVFCILTTIILCSYPALCTEITCLVRNIFAYKKRLTKHLTIILTAICVCIGLYVNNLGIFGYFPLIATASYTILMYITKNEQQMRYALIGNLALWFVHDTYIQAYPGMISDIVISIWAVLCAFNCKYPIKNKLFHKIFAKFTYNTQSVN